MLRQVALNLEEGTGVREIAGKRKAAITVLDCKDLNRKDMALLLDISSAGRNTNSVIADLKAGGVFKKVHVDETEGGPDSNLCVAVLGKPGICQAVHDSGAFCLNCPYSSTDGDGKWRLLVSDSEQLNTLLARLDDHGIKASIGELSGVKGADRLTSHQRDVLAKAISLGYFEFPRRHSLTELSKQVGIKPSTLSQVLRSAEEKVMTRYAAETKMFDFPSTPGGQAAKGNDESSSQWVSHHTQSSGR